MERPLFVEERWDAGVRSGAELLKNGVQCLWQKDTTHGEESWSSIIKMPKMAKQGRWLGAHYHEVESELHIVHRLWVGLISIVDGKFKTTICKVGDVIRPKPMEVHNIFVSPGSVILTQCFGDYHPKDHHIHADLDAHCASLSIDDVMSWGQQQNRPHLQPV